MSLLRNRVKSKRKGVVPMKHLLQEAAGSLGHSGRSPGRQSGKTVLTKSPTAALANARWEP